ncbi:MAG: bifunctional diaminohydroxyphosphoribosylaminopyrimidine deaminase/5-amino-6-(5-phosphoribosylamino)uracil reductase RibD [Spirochaetia bacterium]|nr:bifunctional diaminohydroxyphosphoribosylaminopyrimidine deaminase/5-amino-6-(5-phosphoribosylamino)uracil reductase RibD [Spirochaetia bacterium]
MMNYLLEAFRQSIYAIGNSDPNPPVGAVIVDKVGRLIGAGYTQAHGSHHAEIMAIESAKRNFGLRSLADSTLFVTLEPCSHYGKTPPCTLAIVDSKIARVVIGSRDFSGKVDGVSCLVNAGVDVEISGKEFFKEELLWTLDAFHFVNRNKRPRIFLKWAQTRNGNVAPKMGTSGPISGKESQELVFRMRKMFQCVLATPGTVYDDRPLLNPRYKGIPVSGIRQKNFFSEILLAFESNYPEALRNRNKRFLMMPSFSKNWQAGDLQKYIKLQESLPGQFFLITDDKNVLNAMGDHKKNGFLVKNYDDLDSLFSFVYENGAINLMIEAGPGFSEKIWGRGFVDFAIAFESTEKIWNEGRSFQASRAIAANDEKYFLDHGYQQLYRYSLAGDDLRIYKKDESL